MLGTTHVRVSALCLSGLRLDPLRQEGRHSAEWTHAAGALRPQAIGYFGAHIYLQALELKKITKGAFCVPVGEEMLKQDAEAVATPHRAGLMLAFRDSCDKKRHIT